MIREDYVSFETAKLLKEKGFDECTICSFDKDGNPKDILRPFIESDGDVRKPTLQMAMKWLREVHNYDVGVCLDSYVEPYDNLYYIVIRRRKDKYENISPCEQAYYDTYEEACEAAIKYCLENLI
jgi:hypothetical protein